MKSSRSLLGLLLLVIVSNVFSALYIEREALFIRTTGKPQAETVNFSIANPAGAFVLKVQNGPPGYYRISSADVSINLNGTPIFTASDFNQQVEWLEEAVTVGTTNTIQVTLTSKPDAALKILVYRVDNDIPAISIASPLNNATLSSNRPTIIVNYNDNGSGIDLNSLHILINQIDKISSFTKSGSSATWTIPVGMELPDGANTGAGDNRRSGGEQCRDREYIHHQRKQRTLCADCVPG
jgi:hypothetical protein